MTNKLKKETYCPRCDNKLDGFTEMKEGTTPKSGDVTVCLYCSAVLEFTDDMMLDFAPIDVIEEVMLELSRAQMIVKEYNEQKKENL